MYNCDNCTVRRKKAQGCPDTVPFKKPTRFPDGIPVGGGRYFFANCPGYYIRSYDTYTVDGSRTPFDIVWAKHWAFSSGQDIGRAPKTIQAVQLIEQERRARDALSMEEHKKEFKKKGSVSLKG